MKTPFNSPRDPALPPYHLRNGVTERAEIDRHEAEHRLRMGMPRMPKGRDEFDLWLAQTYGVVGENRREMMWAAWQAAQR